MQVAFTFYTLATERVRQLVESALARGVLVLDGAGERTADSGQATIMHAGSLASLFSQYNYSVRSCLIVDVAFASTLLNSAPARAPVQSLLSLVAGWDCSVLLACSADWTELEPLWRSPTARRCAVADPQSMSSCALRMILMQVCHQVLHLQPVRTPISHELVAVLARVPEAARVLLWQALQAPEEWNVERLASAYGVTRRSLERKHQQWGLPSPSALLAFASELKQVSNRCSGHVP
jgi:hypothetical protein